MSMQQQGGYNSTTNMSATNNNNNNASVGVVVTTSSSTSNNNNNNNNKNNQAATAEVSPFSEWWRYVVLFFLAGSVGAGVASIVLGQWWTVGSLTFGITDFSSTGTCSSGLDPADRIKVILSMACTGAGFAFFGWFFLFFSGVGMHAGLVSMISVSLAGWVTAVVMWALNYQNCDNACATCEFGMGFWLAVASGGSSLIAWILAFTYQMIACCASPPPKPRAATTTTTATTGGAVGTDSVGTTAANSAATSAQQQQQMEPVSYHHQQQQQQPGYGQNDYENVIRARELDYSQAEGHQSFTDVADAFDPNDPGSVGLDAGWYYDEGQAMWWSEEQQLWYDHKTRRYADPATGAWTNENGEWES